MQNIRSFFTLALISLVLSTAACSRYGKQDASDPLAYALSSNRGMTVEKRPCAQDSNQQWTLNGNVRMGTYQTADDAVATVAFLTQGKTKNVTVVQNCPATTAPATATVAALPASSPALAAAASGKQIVDPYDLNK
jgi:hypothetical protein